MHPIKLETVQRFVRENLADSELSIGRIAAAMSCSKRYLHTIFEETGETLGEFIWRSRVEACARDLSVAALRERTIETVAHSHGFNSSTHFGRLFKARYGVTPTEYRLSAGTSHPQVTASDSQSSVG